MPTWIASGPGSDWQMAIDSRISSFDSQPRSATSSRSNRLAKPGMEDPVQWAIAVICLLVTVVMQAEVALLFIGAGLIGILYYGSLFRRPPPVALQVAAVPALAQLAPIASGSTLGKLLLFFLKAGSLTFGSGLVIVPFLEQGLVQQYGWLDERQFLIAVAVGMISPGRWLSPRPSSVTWSPGSGVRWFRPSAFMAPSPPCTSMRS